MNAPARPVEEVQAMEAYGWELDSDGDYVTFDGVLMAPYWDEIQPGIERLNDLWEFREYADPDKQITKAFDTPIAAALWWALEQSNN